MMFFLDDEILEGSIERVESGLYLKMWEKQKRPLSFYQHSSLS